MKRKRARRGFTIVEVLIAVAILAIFVSMAVVGTSALFGTGEQMMAVGKAAVLGSDVMKAVTNEVRFGEEFAMSGEGTDAKLTYNSTAYGDKCRIEVEGGELLFIRTPSAVEGSSVLKYRPLSTAAYGEVRIKSLTFTLKEEEAKPLAITCSLTITSDGTDSLWEKQVTIVPLYLKATV